MTISNTLNGCCSCYNYTRAENPIKNITHTWYLPSGGKTHLIRHDDKIEFLNIQGKEKTSTFTNLADIPTVFSSPEEFIEFMIEMDPIFDANGKLEFTDTEKLHVWKVKYENPVELVTAVNELYLKTMSDKVTVLRKFSASDELLLEEQVSWAKERYPHVYGQKDSCKFSFEEKIKERKSAIDKKTLIDMDHWCVTMFNSDTSGIWEAYLPCTWMGHALLVVETIEEGNYFARQIDLVKDQEGDANVRLFELPKHLTERYVKNYAKSETHRRPKEDIQRMIDQIWRKVCNQKEGNPSVFFKIDGDKRPFWERFCATNDYSINDPDFLNKGSDVANCAKFCVEAMEVANIKPLLSSGCVLSNEVFKTPVLYTGSKVKAVMQESLMITLQTGLYSGISACAAWSIVGLNSSVWGVVGLTTFNVVGPIAAVSALTGGLIGTLCGGLSWVPPTSFNKGKMIAASIGAVGGGIASLARVAMKYEENNQKTIKPLLLKKDK